MPDPILRPLLQRMLVDIQDPETIYWVYCNYFDIQPPTDRTTTRWWHAPLFVDYDSLWRAEFVDDGLLCEVILKNQLPAQKERIKIPYSEIYRVTRFPKGGSILEKDAQLFYDSAKFRTLLDQQAQ